MIYNTQISNYCKTYKLHSSLYSAVITMYYRFPSRQLPDISWKEEGTSVDIDATLKKKNKIFLMPKGITSADGSASVNISF